MEGRTVRIIHQPLAGGLELCSRLGLILMPTPELEGLIHTVLADSPSARAGLKPRDIILAVDKTPWRSVRHLTFSDRRSSELKLRVFVVRYFTIAAITVRVSPEPYRPIEEIIAEATDAVAKQPPSTIACTNPNDRLGVLRAWPRSV
jgi:hypothetical protein